MFTSVNVHAGATVGHWPMGSEPHRHAAQCDMTAVLHGLKPDRQRGHDDPMMITTRRAVRALLPTAQLTVSPTSRASSPKIPSYVQ